MYQVSFDHTEFMASGWLQQALVFKQGMKNFVDPLSPEALACLAMKPDIQSCLVTCHEQQWQAQLGPFNDLVTLGETNSCLLLEAVDHWLPQVNQLAEAFQFIPNWRFDAIAAAYTKPEGGLGPHIDPYSVFIIQGKGKHRWRVGAKQILKETYANQYLKHCEPFDAVIDVVLEAGDVLYIPPGCPNQGYALDVAMSYKVSFRAPSSLELLTGFADYLLQHRPQTPRFFDAKRCASQEFGRIAEHESQMLNKMMVKLLSSPELSAQFLGEYLSRSRYHSQQVALYNTEQQLGLSELAQRVEQGCALRRCAGIKALYLDVLPYQIFVDGQAYSVPNCSWALARSMCDHNAIDAHSLRALKRDSHQFDWLLDLLNRGYWYFDSIEAE